MYSKCNSNCVGEGLGFDPVPTNVVFTMAPVLRFLCPDWQMRVDHYGF